MPTDLYCVICRGMCRFRLKRNDIFYLNVVLLKSLRSHAKIATYSGITRSTLTTFSSVPQHPGLIFSQLHCNQPTPHEIQFNPRNAMSLHSDVTATSLLQRHVGDRRFADILRHCYVTPPAALCLTGDSLIYYVTVTSLLRQRHVGDGRVADILRHSYVTPPAAPCR